MARPRTITDEQIIEAARSVFMADGVGASTSAIARAAGVSEGTIYKRFPTKDALFKRAMGCQEGWDMHLEARLGTGDVLAHLREIAAEVVAHLRVVVPRMTTFLTHSRTSARDFWRDNPDASPGAALRRLTAYLQAEMDAGRLRRTDPSAVARMIVGTVHNFVFFEHVGMHVDGPRRSEDFVRDLIDALWLGVAPEAQQASTEA